MKQIHAVILVLLLAACAPKTDTRGYTNDDDWKQEIVAGQTTKDEVQEKLGSPSSQSTFGTDSWYYISTKRETFAFFAPETVAQEVVVIEFDSGGLVSAVKAHGLADSKEFDLVKRTTPTEGHSLGFVEQVVGNIGRFNKGDGANTPRRPTNTSGY